MATTETGVFTETYARGGSQASPAGTISDMISRLTSDIGTLISLKLELIKMEIFESVAGYAKDAMMLVIAGAMGLCSFVFLNVSLVLILAWLMPFKGAVNLASAAGILAMVYILGAAIIITAVRKRLSTRTLVPVRTVEELKKDKQWLSETVT